MPTIKVAGNEIDVPGWCSPIFGVLVCIAATALVYRMVVPAEPELVSVKQANERLEHELAHYNLHSFDEPKASFSDPSGSVSVRAYGDACLLVSQRFGMASTTRLLIGLGERRKASVDLSAAVFPVLEASETQGRCWDPHPGRFQSGYGPRHNECVVEVYRTFEDSCQHTQLFDACRGSWQTNSDGSPRVRWLRCVH